VGPRTSQDGISNLNDRDMQMATANGLLIERKHQEALPILEEILKQHPDDTEALLARATAWQGLGEHPKAAAEYEKLVQMDLPYPRNLVTINNLAYLLATSADDSVRDGKRAVELAKRAEQIQGTPSPDILDTLAATYAATGDFARAISTQQEAIKLAPERASFRQRLQLYQSGKPLREPAAKPRGSISPDENREPKDHSTG
jgi:tetratricopeptide (TPR) repeat protein